VEISEYAMKKRYDLVNGGIEKDNQTDKNSGKID
jgi:hypothetical protein